MSVVYGASSQISIHSLQVIMKENRWTSKPRAGLISISTRRSACFSVMSFPARNRLGRIVLYFQRNGRQVGFGSGGFRRVICAHKGKVLLFSTSRSSCSVVS